MPSRIATAVFPGAGDVGCSRPAASRVGQRLSDKRSELPLRKLAELIGNRTRQFKRHRAIARGLPAKAITHLVDGVDDQIGDLVGPVGFVGRGTRCGGRWRGRGGRVAGAGGLAPYSLLPDWARTIARVFPSYWYLRGMDDVFVRRLTFGRVVPDVLALVACAAGALVVGAVLLRVRGGNRQVGT